MTVDRWSVTYSKDGWFLTLDRVPLWALAADRVSEWLVEVLDHPCCGYRACEHPNFSRECEATNHEPTVWSRLRDMLPGPEPDDDEDLDKPATWKGKFDRYQWKFLQSQFLSPSVRHEKYVMQVPINEAEARVLAPDFVDSVNQMRDDES